MEPIDFPVKNKMAQRVLVECEETQENILEK